MSAEYEGSPTVNPAKQKVNGRYIKGWIIEQVLSSGERLRRSIELFKPNNVPVGCEAKPLVDGEDVAKPANPIRIVRSEVAPVQPANPAEASKFNEEKLVELKRTCKINQNQGAKTIDIAYVLLCLEGA